MSFDQKEYMKKYNQQPENKAKVKEYNKKYYGENKMRIAEQSKKYRKDNRERINDYWRRNKDKKREKDRRYQLKHKEKIREHKKIYAEKNKIHICEKSKKYYENNFDKIKLYLQRKNIHIKKYARKYSKNRRLTDIHFRISTNLRSAFNKTFKKYTRTGKIMSSKKYGINYKAIIEHLKPFPKNISDYHIDHIQPLVSFCFINEDGSTNLKEIQKAFAPENHQWLTAQENLNKSAKW